MVHVGTVIDTVLKIIAARTGENIAITIDNSNKYIDNNVMSKPLTHLLIEIDLTQYAEESRVTIARYIIAKGLHSGMFGPDDIARIFSGDEELMNFLAELSE